MITSWEWPGEVVKGLPGEVVKVVHDDSHEEVQHEEAAEEDEGDKVSIGEVRAAGLLRVQHLDLNIFQSKIT